MLSSDSCCTPSGLVFSVETDVSRNIQHRAHTLCECAVFPDDVGLWGESARAWVCELTTGGGAPLACPRLGMPIATIYCIERTLPPTSTSTSRFVIGDESIRVTAGACTLRSYLAWVKGKPYGIKERAGKTPQTADAVLVGKTTVSLHMQLEASDGGALHIESSARKQCERILYGHYLNPALGMLNGIMAGACSNPPVFTVVTTTPTGEQLHTKEYKIGVDGSPWSDMKTYTQTMANEPQHIVLCTTVFDTDMSETGPPSANVSYSIPCLPQDARAVKASAPVLDEVWVDVAHGGT